MTQLSWPLLAAIACGGSPARTSHAIAPDQRHKLETALAGANYDVREGAFTWWDVQACVALNMPTCFGNNPSSPYGVVRLPRLPDEPAHTEPVNWFQEQPSSNWRLRPDEAIVVVGRTPPELRYFGFTPYLYNRKFDRTRYDVFASLGDTTNHDVVGNAVTGGSPYDRDIAIVFASSPEIENQVRALVTGALPGWPVLTKSLPGTELHMGLAADSDTLMVLMRVALFRDSAAKDRYLSSTPFTVLRVTPRTERAVTLSPKPTLLDRTPPNDEREYLASRDALVAAVKSRLSTFAEVTTVRGESLLPDSGFDCIAKPQPCLGDNRDSPYLTTLPQRFPASGTSLFVVGINHHAAHRATYANVSIYDFAQLRGVNSIVDGDLVGSADPYLPDDENRQYLYVHEFARDCGPRRNCTAVGFDEFGIRADGLAVISERAYVHPDIHVGGWGERMLPPVLLMARQNRPQPGPSSPTDQAR